MKVVHLSTYDVDGGAARAAFRIHESLLAAGVDSTMLVRVKHSGQERVHAIPAGNPTTAYLADLIQKYYLTYNRTELSNTWFSLGWPGAAVFEHPLIKETDVVNLHWVAGLVSPATLRALGNLRKPIIWTLHDQRPFTGGCHYSAGCPQYETGCKNCPQLQYDGWHLTAANLSDQAESVAAVQPAIVAPSRWLADCARRSLVFQRSRTEVIPYGIDTTRFRAVDQAEARRRLLLPPDAFLLLCGVDNASEKRKGLGALFAMMARWDGGKSETQRGQQLGVLCFGEMDSIPAPVMPLRKFGRVRSDEELSLIYSAADLFVHPSLEDNFPNTVLESMACGTPVVAFRTGGAAEMIADTETGFLISCGDTDKLGQVLLECAEEPDSVRRLRSNCRKRVEESFSYARQARDYVQLYQELRGAIAPKPANQRQTPGEGARPAEAAMEFLAEEPGPALAKILPGLVKHAFDCRVDVTPPKRAPSSNDDGQAAQIKYAKRVTRILKAALKNGEPFQQLKAEVEAEIAELEGTAHWTARATRVVKRWLGAL